MTTNESSSSSSSSSSEAGVAEGDSDSRPGTANRPPSYASEDGVGYVMDARPRSIAPPPPGAAASISASGATSSSSGSGVHLAAPPLGPGDGTLRPDAASMSASR